MRARSFVALAAAVAISTTLGMNNSQAATGSPSTSPSTASGAPAGSATTSSPTAASAATAMTSITLVVKGCDGCTIGVQRGLKNEPASKVTPKKPDAWDGPKAVVKNGIAKLSEPTAYTAGSSFTVSAPWEGQTDGMTNIVLGGKTPVSTLISVKQATHRKFATACWAGTQDGQAIIRVTVIKRMMDGMNNKPTAFPIAWASPTVATVGSLSKTLGKGLLGNQDMYFC